MGFQHGVEDIAAFDQVAAPATVTDIDPGAGTVIDGGVSYVISMAIAICTPAGWRSTRPMPWIRQSSTDTERR